MNRILTLFGYGNLLVLVRINFMITRRMHPFQTLFLAISIAVVVLLFTHLSLLDLRKRTTYHTSIKGASLLCLDYTAQVMSSCCKSI